MPTDGNILFFTGKAFVIIPLEVTIKAVFFIFLNI